MRSIELNIDDAKYFAEKEYEALGAEATAALTTLEEGTGDGNDFLGWQKLPSETPAELVERIEKTAARLRQNCDYVVCVGIGGSYLGAKAVNSALADNFEFYYAPNPGEPKVLYAGQNISEDYTAQLEKLLTGKRFGIIVISKSGTTTEPAIAFRILKEKLEKEQGKDKAKDLIVAITDEKKGALRTMATNEGFETYVIPDNVGGRFSVLTPVGLLPIAVAGHDIKLLLKGAADMENTTLHASPSNPALTYARLRNALYRSGKKIELLVNFDPRLHFFSEWWKQLYGESEGKDGKGIFPAAEVDQMAELGTKMAHVDGGVPNIRIEIEQVDEYSLGQLIYFFEKACGISGYMLGVNPFNQPGVEFYKSNMFKLLKKPGYC